MRKGKREDEVAGKAKRETAYLFASETKILRFEISQQFKYGEAQCYCPTAPLLQSESSTDFCAKRLPLRYTSGDGTTLGHIYQREGAGIPHAVQRLDTNWAAEGSHFESR
jgi:hypothetical protein